MKLRVIVVDDEPLARRRLVAMVSRTAIAEVVGEADNADRAQQLIAAVDPDVALVDVIMPGRSGLELARTLGPRPVVVFTTAFGEHAVAAFDAAAADYLVKPIAADKLARALDRAAARLAGTRSDEPRVTARSGETVQVFAALAITRFRAEAKYTIFVIDGREHLIDESLDALESRLAAWGFLRVHRSELVQLSQIRALEGIELVLTDEQRVSVSRRMLAQVRKNLAKR